MKSDSMLTLQSTGERFLLENFDENAVEHLHRYGFAASFCIGANVLDIASGEGYGANILATKASYVTGVDISPDAVTHAQTKYGSKNLRYIVGSTESIPLETSTIDIVVSFETIEHHDRHEEMLTEIKRVLKPSGILLMSTPDKYNYSDVPGFNNEFHVKELYLEQFSELIHRYFKNVVLCHQAFCCGSMITPINKTNEFRYYWGDFNNIYERSYLTRSIYNICISSDEKIPQVGASFLDGGDNYNRYKIHGEKLISNRLLNARKELYNVYNSKSYRLGSIVLNPIKKMLKAIMR